MNDDQNSIVDDVVIGLFDSPRCISAAGVLSVRRGRRVLNQNGLAFPKSDARRLRNGEMPFPARAFVSLHGQQEVDSLGVCRKYYNLTETALRMFPGH
jgi:hypothetical protein